MEIKRIDKWWSSFWNKNPIMTKYLAQFQVYIIFSSKFTGIWSFSKSNRYLTIKCRFSDTPIFLDHAIGWITYTYDMKIFKKHNAKVTKQWRYILNGLNIQNPKGVIMTSLIQE